jgi:hypothetical protein
MNGSYYFARDPRLRLTRRATAPERIGASKENYSTKESGFGLNLV